MVETAADAPRHFADVGLAAADARIDGEFVAAAARQYVAAAQARFQPPRDGDDEIVAGPRHAMLVLPAYLSQGEQSDRHIRTFLDLDTTSAQSPTPTEGAK